MSGSRPTRTTIEFSTPGLTRVLLVDDDHENRVALAEQLASRYEVRQACDGRAAVELAQRENVDIVLMGVHLPIMNGLEATQEIRSRMGDRHIPIVLMTSDDDDEVLAAGLAAGGDDFLCKPVSPLLVKSKIDALVRARDLFRRVRLQRDELRYFRDRAERDYDIAKRLYASIAYRGCLALPSIAFQMTPLDAFNGDLLMASPLEGGRLRLFMGDFAGHGLAAAVGALPLADVFYAMTERRFGLPSIVREMNAKIHRTLPRNMFFAACLIDIEPGGADAPGRLTVWNGGLPDALVIDRAHAVRVRLSSQHPPLGVLPPDQFDASLTAVELAPEDRLFVYTDGVIEVNDESGAMFGSERLEALLTSESSWRQWPQRLQEALDQHRGRAVQHDDITFLVVANDAALHRDLLDLAPAAVRPETNVLLVKMELDVAALRQPEPLAPLHSVLRGCAMPAQDVPLVQTVLSELFSNALEHGILNLSSRLKESPEGFELYYRQRTTALRQLAHGWMRIQLEVGEAWDGGFVRLRIEDSGPGFAPSDTETPRSTPARSGRGVDIVRKLCRQLRWSDGGRVVEAVYPLARQAGEDRSVQG